MSGTTIIRPAGGSGGTKVVNAPASGLTKAQADGFYGPAAGQMRAAFADRRATNSNPTRTVTLIGGQPDETLTISGGTVAADTTNYRIGTQGWKISLAAAGTATAYVLYATPRVVPIMASLGAWVYVPDHTIVSAITFEVWPVSNGSPKWARAFGTLVDGWNFIRWPASDGITPDANWASGNIYRIRIIVTTTAAGSVTVGHFFGECPMKAQVLFIADRGYKSFYDIAYPDLKARGIPVTWALDPTLLGSNPGTISEAITAADLQAIAAETVVSNDISIHSYDGSVTSSMTAAQLQADQMNAVKTIQGLLGNPPGLAWRAAFTQNAATNASAIQSLVLAYATPSSAAGLTCWPFANRWNVPRIALHGLTQASMDTWFQQLHDTRQVMPIYTHAIDDGGGENTTNANWDYFVSKLDAGIAGGWLEGVTFTDLFARSGGKFRRGFGDTVAEYYDSTGALVTKRLP